MILTRNFPIGERIKYRLKKTHFTFLSKGWSIALYNSTNFLEKKSWKKLNSISRFNLNAKEINGLADPFLLKWNQNIFLFMELIIRNKGEIWVSEIQNKKILAPHKVLSASYHFSYPYVFIYKDELYMIPETSENNSVSLYKTKNFPCDWKLHKELYLDEQFVDTNLLIVNQIFYWFTYDLNLKQTRLFFSDDLCGDWIEHPKSKYNCNRNAGAFIYIENKIIRPIQVSKDAYGEGVALMLLTKISKECLEEELYDAAYLEKENGFRFNGVHHISVLKECNLIAIDGKNNNYYKVNSKK